MLKYDLILIELSINIHHQNKEVIMLVCDSYFPEGYDRPFNYLSWQQADIFVICFSIEDRISFDNVIEKVLPQIA